MSSVIKNVLCKTFLILIIGFTFLTTSYAHAQQQTVVVRVDGDNGLAIPNPPNPGDTWTNAFKYLPDAIAHAALIADFETTVELWVAATVPINPYVPDRDAANPGGTGNPFATFLLDFNNILLLGGFEGIEIDPDDRDPAVHITVLSGKITAIFDCGDPEAGDCFQDNGTGSCNNQCGGLPCPTCCQVVCAQQPECCTAPWDQDCADLAVVLCNVCGEPGSGDCFMANGSPGCEDGDCCALVCNIDPFCCIDEWNENCANLANDICSPPLLGEPAKSYHVVTADGVDDSVRIDGFTITDGLALGGGPNGLVGAGLLIVDASLAVVRVTFTENAAPAHGGGAMDIRGDSDPLVVNTSFIGNTGREAGALHTEDGTAGGMFVNCLFSGNSSIIEGGAINPGGGESLTFINCTLANNSVDFIPGGGAIFTESGAGPVILINCILWGNTVNNQPNQINETEAEVVIVTYSDVEGGWPCPPGMPNCGNIGEDLILHDPLFVDPLNGNYRLDALSPCIDKGNPDETVIPVDQFDVDQDGDMDERTPDLDLNDRLIDTNASCIVGIVDMGAYEAPPCCPWDMDDDGAVGVSDLLTLLGAWGSDPGGPPDFDCSGDVGVSDFLDLLGKWGPCPCGVSTTPLSLEEELADACLTEADWDEYVDVMTDADSSQADKDRYDCWMRHYLLDCNNCTCPRQSGCPNPDPFN